MSVEFRGKSYKIEDVNGIKYLQLNAVGIRDISEIKKLEQQTHLQVLDLSYNKISEIKNLETLTNLLDLRLAGNQIKKIENLENLTQLKTLIFNNNQITKIEELETSTNLKSLFLGNNQISKIENIDHLTKLSFLECIKNKIPELENLDALTSLKTLNLMFNKIKEIKNLDSLINLQTLDLSSNLISNIEKLDSLKDLRALFLSGNKISEIKKLDKLNKLKFLNLASNQITEIRNLEALTQLEHLNLSNNRITEIKGLTNLTRLRVLRLEYNPLSFEEIHLLKTSIPKVLDYCKKREQQPISKVELNAKRIKEYKEYIESVSEEEILDLGTWRENDILRDKQNAWFLAYEPNEIPLNKFNKNIREVQIYMVQIHSLSMKYNFKPDESIKDHFFYFVKQVWRPDAIESNVLQYDVTDLGIFKKTNEIMELILRDPGKNKLIIFPENSIPNNYLKGLINTIKQFKEINTDFNILFIGGMEHIKSPRYRFSWDDLSKMHKSHKFDEYLNQAIIIDNFAHNIQKKQTPVLIYPNIIESIKCERKPKINIFQTTFGRIAIFICKDFLRLYEVISKWAEENKVDFIVVPSLTSKVLPFNYKVVRIFNKKHYPELKILFVNVGEYGGSEFYSRKRINEIEQRYQKNIRDNIGEVIVKRKYFRE